VVDNHHAMSIAAIVLILCTAALFSPLAQKVVGAVVLALIVWLSFALADPLPQPKPPGPGGSCPHGYASSGSYCVPRAGAQDAIAKPSNGTCPWGWLSSGSYCLRGGSNRRD
jgi:hypothetical protein